MTDRHRVLLVCVLAGGIASGHGWTQPLLGEINIELHGNVVDYSCTVESGDDNKTVQLGTWATRSLRNAGSTTQSIPFTLKLTGCPPGSASVTFSGSKAPGNPALLALNDTSSAADVAVELLDGDKTSLPLEQASRDLEVDANGNVTMAFFARYMALADNPTAGKADADATFMINYN